MGNHHHHISARSLGAADLDRVVAGRPVIADGFGDGEGQADRGRQLVDGAGHGLAEGIVVMQEGGLLGLHPGSLEQVLDQGQPVGGQTRRGGEIAEYRMEALLGDIGRGGDIDDQRHAALLAHPRYRHGVGAVEGADQHLSAVGDQLFGPGARRVDIRFGVGDGELDRKAELRQHAGADVGAALAALALARQGAGQGQQDADLEGCCGRQSQSGSEDRNGGGAGHDGAAADLRTHL